MLAERGSVLLQDFYRLTFLIQWEWQEVRKKTKTRGRN